MITGEQIRAARAMLRLEQAELADLTGVSQVTIKRFEATSGPLKGRDENIRAVVKEIEYRGIEFISDIDLQGKRIGVGVRFAADPHAKIKKLILGVVIDAGDMALVGADLDNHDPEYLAQHLSDNMPKWLGRFMPTRLQFKIDAQEGDEMGPRGAAPLPDESRNDWLRRLEREGLPAPQSKRADAPRRISGKDIVKPTSDDDE